MESQPANDTPDALDALTLPALLALAREPLPQHKATLRVAVIGHFTTDFVVRLMRLYLSRLGVTPEVFEAPYGTAESMVYDAGSELYAFAPQVVVLLPAPEAAMRGGVPPVLTSPDEAAGLADERLGRFQGLWSALRRNCEATILQANLPLPDTRPLGELEATLPGGAVAFVRRFNQRMVELAPPGVQVFDLAWHAASFGLSRAYDPRGQHLHKIPFSFEFLRRVARALAARLAPLAGRGRKCLVLDLDDTLWGGVVGEDGVEGVRIGTGDPEAEAFTAFQRYVKRLRERGILLAVCSKNDDALARRVFEERADMVLKLSDIASFVANWEDKASNLRRIASELSIGTDALVFFDDNPRERHLVRQRMPEVAVIEVPIDSTDYVRALDAGPWFEAIAVNAEDAARTDFFVQSRARNEAESAHEDYDSYLRSLDLEAVVAPFEEPAVARVADLARRSNQFNLRTIRYSEADVRRFRDEPARDGFSITLSDRYGTYGLISALFLETRGDTLFIDNWIMSCRALKKGVEALAFTEIVERARARGLSAVEGEHLPTEKNGMCASLLADFGFEPTAAGGWRLPLDRAILPPLPLTRKSTQP